MIDSVAPVRHHERIGVPETWVNKSPPPRPRNACNAHRRFRRHLRPRPLGHLILAEQAREQGGLDEVWFVPAPRPPQKDSQAITRFDVREEMLELAIAGHPSFRVSAIEKDRTGPSFTVDTLIELHRREPTHTFALIVGSDPSSTCPPGATRAASSPGQSCWSWPGREPGRRRGRAPPAALGPTSRNAWPRRVEAPLIDISSRDIRRRVAEGRSVRYLLPRAIEVFIKERKLYRP